MKSLFKFCTCLLIPLTLLHLVTITIFCFKCLFVCSCSQTQAKMIRLCVCVCLFTFSPFITDFGFVLFCGFDLIDTTCITTELPLFKAIHRTKTLLFASLTHTHKWSRRTTQLKSSCTLCVQLSTLDVRNVATCFHTA
jgi:hypothetical protein